MQTLFATANNVIKTTGQWDSIDQFKTEWLYIEFNVTSTKKLTEKQADEAIRTLQRMLGDGHERASFGQKQKIAALAELLEMDRESVFRFIHKQVGFKKSEHMLTPQEASKVIVGLQRIYSKGIYDVYQKLNKASARYLRSQEGKAELEEMRKETQLV